MSFKLNNIDLSIKVCNDFDAFLCNEDRQNSTPKITDEHDKIIGIRYAKLLKETRLTYIYTWLIWQLANYEECPVPNNFEEQLENLRIRISKYGRYYPIVSVYALTPEQYRGVMAIIKMTSEQNTRIENTVNNYLKNYMRSAEAINNICSNDNTLLNIIENRYKEYRLSLKFFQRIENTYTELLQQIQKELNNIEISEQLLSNIDNYFQTKAARDDEYYLRYLQAAELRKESIRKEKEQYKQHQKEIAASQIKEKQRQKEQEPAWELIQSYLNKYLPDKVSVDTLHKYTEIIYEHAEKYKGATQNELIRVWCQLFCYNIGYIRQYYLNAYDKSRERFDQQTSRASKKKQYGMRNCRISILKMLNHLIFDIPYMYYALTYDLVNVKVHTIYTTNIKRVCDILEKLSDVGFKDTDMQYCVLAGDSYTSYRLIQYDGLMDKWPSLTHSDLKLDMYFTAYLVLAEEVYQRCIQLYSEYESFNVYLLPIPVKLFRQILSVARTGGVSNA